MVLNVLTKPMIPRYAGIFCQNPLFRNWKAIAHFFLGRKQCIDYFIRSISKKHGWTKEHASVLSKVKTPSKKRAKPIPLPLFAFFSLSS